MHARRALARLQNGRRQHLPHDLVRAVDERLLRSVGDGLVGEVQRPGPAHAHGGHAGGKRLAVHGPGLGPLGVVPRCQLHGVEAVLEAEPRGQLGNREVEEAVPDVAL
eukprot:9470910-Pyramimonas_sp.AAC.1